MAKARAIVKRRKAVRNIRKITKTMQMIATAKFQKALKRAVGTKPYTEKIRELAFELGATVTDFSHPLLRQVTDENRTNRIVLLVITSNRGLCGAYNGSVLRKAMAFIREQEAAGKSIDLHVAGKKGINYFNFQKRPIIGRYELADVPRFADFGQGAQKLMDSFVAGEIDGMYVASMDFKSTSRQEPRVLPILPLAGVKEIAEHLAVENAQKKEQLEAGSMDRTRTGENVEVEPAAELKGETTYDFSPDARSLLDYLLPLTVKTALFQCFLDAITSENVARMVAMKSATDNADKMVKALTMQYNRARQSQITTELSEIMGGVEAMKG